MSGWPTRSDHQSVRQRSVPRRAVLRRRRRPTSRRRTGSTRWSKRSPRSQRTRATQTRPSRGQTAPRPLRAACGGGRTACGAAGRRRSTKRSAQRNLRRRAVSLVGGTSCDVRRGVRVVTGLQPGCGLPPPPPLRCGGRSRFDVLSVRSRGSRGGNPLGSRPPCGKERARDVAGPRKRRNIESGEFRLWGEESRRSARICLISCA